MVVESFFMKDSATSNLVAYFVESFMKDSRTQCVVVETSIKDSMIL